MHFNIASYSLTQASTPALPAARAAGD